jgi:hypothetical protein
MHVGVAVAVVMVMPGVIGRAARIAARSVVMVMVMVMVVTMITIVAMIVNVGMLMLMLMIVVAVAAMIVDTIVTALATRVVVMRCVVGVRVGHPWFLSRRRGPAPTVQPGFIALRPGACRA